MDDLIRRQDAINTICQDWCGCDYADCRHPFNESADEYYFCDGCANAEALKVLPSAQSEPLTDKEQRIFLSAMSREEEVCKQVDDEWRDCREPYDDSLVKTCHEITRKVKGALWT